MAIAASLVATLGLDSAQFSAGLRKASGGLKQFQRTAQRVTAAVTAGALGLTYTSNQALLAADEIAKSARNAGLSADAFQRLAESFELGGSSAQALVKGNQALARNIRDLGRGLATQSDAFTDLGLTYEDLRDLSPEDQFLLVRERLAGVTNETDRLAIAQQLFGRAGKEFGSILTENTASLVEQGRRLQELGGIIDEDLLGAAEEFNDQIGTTSKVIRAQFSTALLEALQQAGAFQDVDDTIRAVGEAVHSAASAVFGFIQVIVEWRKQIAAVFAAWFALKAIMFSVAALKAVAALAAGIKLVGVVALAAAKRVGLLALAGLKFIAPFAAVAALLTAAAAAIKGFVENSSMLWEGLGNFITALFDGVILDLEYAWLGFKDFLQDTFRDLGNGIVGLLNDALSAYNDIRDTFGEDPIPLITVFEDPDPDDLDIQVNREERMDATTRRQEAQGQISAGFGMAVGGGVGEVSGAFESITSGFTDTFNNLKEGFLDFLGITDDSTEAIMRETAAKKDNTDETENSTKALGPLATEIRDNLSTNLSQAIAKGDFSSVGEVFVSTIQASLQEQVAESLKGIFDDLFGTLLGAFGFGGPRADGGPVSPNRTYLVGERGPELFTPRGAGQIISNEDLQGGGTQQFVFNITGDVTEATQRVIRDMAPEIASQTQETFRERGIGGFAS